MTPGLPSFDLNRTIAGRWRRQVAGIKADAKPHWQTKVAYYAAACELVAADPTRRLTWRCVVDAVRPRGSSSTFYEVTGRNAKYALVQAYLRAGGPDALQIALSYQRRSAVDQLIDEAKVWAFWPYREGWLRHCEESYSPSASTATDALAAVLAEWTRRNPGVAAALNYAPPACTVEDVVAVHRGRFPALRAEKLLTEVMRSAAQPGGGVPPAVPAPPAPDDLLVDLAERIYALSMDARRLAPVDATVVRESAATLMADAIVGLQPT